MKADMTTYINTTGQNNDNPWFEGHSPRKHTQQIVVVIYLQR